MEMLCKGLGDEYMEDMVSRSSSVYLRRRINEMCWLSHELWQEGSSWLDLN